MGAAEEEAEVLGEKVAEFTTSINNILGSLQGLEKWIPCVDSGIRELNKAVDGIAVRVTQLEAMTPTTPLQAAQAPVGHGIESTHQGDASEAFKAKERTLVKSKPQFHHSPVSFEMGETSEKGVGGSSFSVRSASPRLPKTDFPKFDGDNPKLWKTNSEKYFEMYQVPYNSWSSFATLHFIGNAALWLQTYEALHPVETWAELVVAVNGKFGRDKYQQHLEELENLKQCGSVDEYYVKFEELMHRVLVYNRSYDETFFVTKFVGGLKREVKIAIKLHKPRTVDLALSLAKTQEELLGELSASKAQQKVTVKERFKGGIKPAYVAKGILGAHPEENKKGEEKPKWEDRYESLKAARRASGECFKYGEKWRPGHKCPKSVQLHVLDELLEVLMLQDGTADIQKEEEEDSEEELVPSECTAAGTMGKKTIRLQGMIQHQEVLILVDSGSSSNFIAESLVSKLQLPTERMPATSVTHSRWRKDDL